MWWYIYIWLYIYDDICMYINVNHVSSKTWASLAASGLSGNKTSALPGWSPPRIHPRSEGTLPPKHSTIKFSENLWTYGKNIDLAWKKPMENWLVVLTILKTISQWVNGTDYPIIPYIMEKNMFETTNQKMFVYTGDLFSWSSWQSWLFTSCKLVTNPI